MITLFLGIAAAVALGALITYAVVVTFNWLRNKIKNKMAQRNVKKTAVADIEKLIDECDNKVSMDELMNMSDEGYSHVIVSVDDNNQVVGDVEIIKDTNDELDADVERLLGRERMIVVEG